MFRSFENLVLKPTWIEARKLGIGQVAIARNHYYFRAFITSQIGSIPKFFPAHFALRFNKDRIDQHIFVPVTLEHRDHLHGETHLRRPKTIEALAPQQMTSQPKPPFGLAVPIRLGSQRVDRVIKTAADELDIRAPISIRP